MSEQTLPKLRAFLLDNPLLVTLVAAIIVHLLPMLGDSNVKPELKPISRSIDITLVNAPSEKAPEKVQALAAENQLGAGQQAQKPAELPPQQAAAPKQEAPKPKVKPPTPKAPPEKIPPKPQEKPVPKAPPEKISQPEPEPEPEPEKVKPKPIKEIEPQPSKAEIQQKLLVQQRAEQKIVIPETQEKPVETSKPDAEQKTVKPSKQAEKPHHISTADLERQIADMGMQIRQQPASEMQIKVKTVSQVSANKYVAAQYLKDWETKVASVGNRNYPEEAIKAGFSATLILEVNINAEGGVENMRITQSSGNPKLDEAAKKIVRMSAPFPPLPAALLKELDMLKIIRVWKFSDESGVVTH